MDLDDLLDAVDVKGVHFPVYTCTSVIVSISPIVANLVKFSLRIRLVKS